MFIQIFGIDTMFRPWCMYTQVTFYWAGLRPHVLAGALRRIFRRSGCGQSMQRCMRLGLD